MGDGVPDDELLECLAHPHRRYTVFYLQQHSNPIPVAELATKLAACERDTAISSVSEDAVEQVHIALHHIHLPRLEAAGLVELDTGHEQVATTDGTSVAERLRRKLVDVQEQFVNN